MTAKLFPSFSFLKWHVLTLLLNLKVYLSHLALTLKFRRRVGYWPTRYHEKIYWRKVFDRNPLHGTFCDKLATKAFIKNTLPDAQVAHTLWIGTCLDDGAQQLLNSAVVLKANHLSSANMFADGFAKGHAYIANTIQRWIERKHYWYNFQPAYRLAKPCVFIEELIGTPEQALTDIYVRACDGEVIVAAILTNTKRDGQLVGYYDANGKRLQHLERGSKDKHLPPDYPLPARFADAITYTEKLSRGVDFARFDYLCSGDHIWAGEITVYPNAGLSRANPDPTTDMNALVNQRWDLRKSNFFQATLPPLLSAYRRLLSQHLDQQYAAASTEHQVQ